MYLLLDVLPSCTNYFPLALRPEKLRSALSYRSISSGKSRTTSLGVNTSLASLGVQNTVGGGARGVG